MMKQMKRATFNLVNYSVVFAFAFAIAPTIKADDSPSVPKACIDGTGLGWRKLGESDFVNVNTARDTWSWKDGVVHCTGKPTGVMRTTRQFTNFELVAQWQH